MLHRIDEPLGCKALILAIYKKRARQVVYGRIMIMKVAMRVKMGISDIIRTHIYFLCHRTLLIEIEIFSLNWDLSLNNKS